MILAGDIGGTSTRLALFEVRGGRLSAVRIERYSSPAYRGLDEIVRAFTAVGGLPPIDEACFGVAGPVMNGRAATPNLPWVVEAAALARQLGLPRAWLINDLEANTHGVAALVPADLAVLGPGAPAASGNIAVISAGTGLGEAGAYWDGVRHHPFAGEGGHADFAPQDELQVELFLHLRGKLGGRVSWERVVSGPGLQNIYEFLRDSGRGREPAWLRDAMQREDPPAMISQAALAGTSELCGRALDLFVTLYGAEAGNLALKLKATGGVYVGGGIAPRISERMKAGSFMEAFRDKGRLRDLLERVPVRIILNDQAALLGAARYAALNAGLLEGVPPLA